MSALAASLNVSPAFVETPKLVANVLQFLPSDQIDDVSKIFASNLRQRDDSMSAMFHIMAKRFDELPDSNLIKIIWKTQKVQPLILQAQIISTIQCASHLCPQCANIANIDFFDIESLSDEIIKIPASAWEKTFHLLVRNGDIDYLKIVLDFHTLPGALVGEALIQSVLNKPICVQTIVQSPQFKDIPLYLVATAYYYALSCAEKDNAAMLYATGRIPGNYMEFIPKDALSNLLEANCV